MAAKSQLKLVSKAELARIVNLSKAAITKAARNDFPKGMLAGRVNLNHHDVIYYANKHDVDLSNHKAPPPVKPKKAPPPLIKGINSLTSTKKHYAQAALADPVVDNEIPEEITAFTDMTLRELIYRFGTDMAFVDWLKATKAIEDINEKRLKNAVARGELVNRQVIKVGVFDPINETFGKLLTDCSKTLAVRVRAMIASGQSTGDCEKFISDQIGSFIRPAKAKIVRALKNA